VIKPAIGTTLLIYLLSGAPASADVAAANTCASSLDHEARLVFDTVQADPQADVSLRNVLAAKVGGLVAAGKLSIFSARSAATAASECLRIARNCTAEVC
jgi:hypothetical protein